MPICAPRCAARSGGCSSACRSPPCSSPTTRKRRWRCPTGSAVMSAGPAGRGRRRRSALCDRPAAAVHRLVPRRPHGRAGPQRERAIFARRGLRCAARPSRRERASCCARRGCASPRMALAPLRGRSASTACSGLRLSRRRLRDRHRDRGGPRPRARPPRTPRRRPSAAPALSARCPAAAASLTERSSTGA